MKSTPAVFLTSLAVSAISITMPLPAATTVFNLFIGEDLTAQHIAHTAGEHCQQATHHTGGADTKAACPTTVKKEPEEVTFDGDAPLTDNSGGINPRLPKGFVKYMTGILAHTLYPTLLKTHGPVARTEAYIIRKGEAYKLLTRQWLQGPLPELLTSSGHGLQEVYRGAGAGAVLFTRSM